MKIDLLANRFHLSKEGFTAIYCFSVASAHIYLTKKNIRNYLNFNCFAKMIMQEV